MTHRVVRQHKYVPVIGLTQGGDDDGAGASHQPVIGLTMGSGAAQ